MVTFGADGQLFCHFSQFFYLCIRNRNNGRERNRSLLYFYTMSNEEKTLIINSLVERLLEPETAIFLVRVHIRPINNISVYIDGDEGVTIDKCVKLNRALYKLIVEEEVCKDGEFGLEVSSPGVDEPLTMLRQYKKNLGRLVEVECADGKKVEGKLLGADETGIEVEEEKGKGKKKEIVKHALSFADVKSTVVKIVF